MIASDRIKGIPAMSEDHYVNPDIRQGTTGFGLRSRSVAVALLPDRIDIIARNGQSIEVAQRIPIKLDTDPVAWIKDLRGIGELLKEVVQENNLEGTPTYVVYDSPTQVVDLVELNISSPSQAREAAIISCAEAIPYSLDAAVTEAIVIGRDPSDDDPQTHVLLVADRQDIATAIVDMIEEAGLDFQTATPLQATVIAKLAGASLRNSQTYQGWLYVGNNSSFFIVAGQGKLRFGRNINIGLETLVESLTRPIFSTGQTPTVELDLATARKILHTHGVAYGDDVVIMQPRLTQNQIVPLMQPILQRLVVELRQSLRFGLPQSQDEPITLAITGPGCNVPGFASLLGQELNMPVTVDSCYADYDYSCPSSPGNDAVIATNNRPFLERMSLQPPDVAQQQTTTHIRRWLSVSLVVALAIVVMDTLSMELRLNGLRAQESAIAGQVAIIDSLRKTKMQLASAVEDMAKLNTTIADQIGSYYDFKSILQDISLLTPQSIQLMNLALRRGSDGLIVTIDGFAIADDVSEQKSELEAYIESLKQSPLFADVLLKNVQVAVVNGSSGDRFEASFHAIELPTSYVSVNASPDNGELKP
ncbi:MAG: PilN domain-containing protein [Planctomycetes bacterium]|nr:PilN domain-containing protein [Planctomycetota bacterium]